MPKVDLKLQERHSYHLSYTTTNSPSDQQIILTPNGGDYSYVTSFFLLIRKSIEIPTIIHPLELSKELFQEDFMFQDKVVLSNM